MEIRAWKAGYERGYLYSLLKNKTCKPDSESQENKRWKSLVLYVPLALSLEKNTVKILEGRSMYFHSKFVEKLVEEKNGTFWCKNYIQDIIWYLKLK